MEIKMPPVERLVEELVKGTTLVQLYEMYMRALSQIEPTPSAEDTKKAATEFRARLQFAWQAARQNNLARRRGA